MVGEGRDGSDIDTVLMSEVVKYMKNVLKVTMF